MKKLKFQMDHSNVRAFMYVRKNLQNSNHCILEITQCNIELKFGMVLKLKRPFLQWEKYQKSRQLFEEYKI